MLFSSIRCLIIPFRYLTIQKRINFDEKIFGYLTTRRFDNQKPMKTDLEKLFQTSSILSYLQTLNSNNDFHRFSRSISFEQLINILFFAYQHQLKLNHRLTKYFIECVQPKPSSISTNFYFEFVQLLVLHQQKYYDSKTKLPNKILEQFLHHLEDSLTSQQIQTFSLNDLSLLASAMFRLQLPIRNIRLLEHLEYYLIEDEQSKSLSAVDKQNFVKILTLSNCGKIDIARALANRFNQSFIPQTTPLNYEIVRMTMRIALYFQTFRFYSEKFFENCHKLIQSESNANQLSYRGKDIIQIMNTLITMGYLRKIDSKYMNLIEFYTRTNQIDSKPERLVDILAPLALIDCFPQDLLNKLFTKDNLRQLTESRMKEKLFFISQSYQVFHPSRTLIDQNFLQTLPRHIYGSWEIEKRKRKNFSSLVKQFEKSLSNVKTAFILKHFKSPNIIIRQSDCQGDFALEILAEDDLCVNDSLKPLGLVFSKLRQLKQLKYVPVIIYPNDNIDESDVFSWLVHRAETTDQLLK